MNIKILFVLSCSFLWGAQTFSQVKVHFDETFKQEKIQVKFREQTYKVTLDDSGKGIIRVPDTLPPGYAVLYGPRKVYMFYLVPGRKQHISVLPEKGIEFSGMAKTVNEYLNGPFLSRLDLEYEKNEKDFLEEWEKLPDNLQAHLDSLPLPSDFKIIERKRLHYVACNMLLIYPLYHARRLHLQNYTPGETYYRKLSEVIAEDPEARECWEYWQVFRDWIQTLGERKKSETGKPLDKLKFELEYIRCNIRDEELAGYLVDASMSGYIRYFGVEGVETFLPFYKEKVKNEEQKNVFLESYSQYLRLEKGRKAPEFSLVDVNGKKQNLSDWLGYYVYIDVWATWCGPCCRELPAFHQLKEQFKDKPICFISISIDTDEAAWKTKIKNDHLDGIQLRVEKGDTFQADYKISLIPRFILIDQAGKILDAKMSRPSDPKTKEMLSALLSDL